MIPLEKQSVVKADILPHVQVLNLSDPPTVEGVSVEFRLTYKGKLSSASRSNPRAKEKHAIRKAFHRQLKELWRVHPYLKNAGELRENDEVVQPNFSHVLAHNFQRCGYRFVPLITSQFGLAASIDILFLRRDSPGNLISSGGDIDNRIKVLFDALRIPNTVDEVNGETPAGDEDPFFCLLEDDNLINRVSITTDQLLDPLHENEHRHNVHLIIYTKVLVVDHNKAPIPFYS